MRPRLVDKLLLKPVIIQPELDLTPITIPQIPVPKIIIPEFDNKSISILINLFFVITLTLIILWLYHLYIDKQNILITDINDITPPNNLQQQPNQPVIPSNIEDIPETFNYI